MGGASTGGGGGGVGPAGMTGTTVVAGKTKRNYGTEKDAKKTSNRFENYNNDNNNGGGNDNTIKQVTETAPTEAEVSQSTTTEAEPDTEANRLLKIKKKGRSASIISGSRGVTKTSTDYSLGKKSLLGRV